MIDRSTFHESWYRVVELRPQLRSTLQTYRQHFRGKPWHVLQDASNNQHFRLDDAAYHFVGLLDGRRTVDEAWQLCNEQLGDKAPTQGEVINLLGQLYSSNLLQSDLPADAAGMFENYRRRVRREVGSYFMNLLFLRIPLFDPDHLLDRWVRLVGPLFGWFGLALWIGLMLVGGSFLVSRVDDLVSGVSGVLAPGNLFLLYVSFAVLKVLHEFGHGFACKRIGQLTGSGGEVHVMGIMLLVFTPVPYVDASSSWAFRSKWHRAFVGAAGMYVELVVAAIAAIVWANTSPGLVNALAYNAIFVASVSTILFNGNPLLRFDGYYILSDLLEIPNLARRSRDYLFFLVKRYVYGVRRAVSPEHTRGERFWLPTYAVASNIYRVFIFAGIILFVADKFFFIGALFAIAGIVSWVAVPLVKFVRYLTTNSELHRVRSRAVITSVAFFAVILAGIGAIPVPDRGRAEGVIEPRELAFVFARSSGFIDEHLPSGRRVTEGGTPLITAHNLELEMRREVLLAERSVAVVQHNLASVNEVALAQSLLERIAALDDQIERVEERLAHLRLAPPAAGWWVAPDIDGANGAFIREGEGLGLVASIDRLLIRAIADQELGPRIEPEIGHGGAVEIRVKGRPDLEFSGTIESVLPSGLEQLPSAALGYLAGGSTQVNAGDETGTGTAEPVFEVRIGLDDDTGAPPLWSGQRVIVRFNMPATPLAAQWYRSLRQLVQRRFQV